VIPFRDNVISNQAVDLLTQTPQLLVQRGRAATDLHCQLPSALHPAQFVRVDGDPKAVGFIQVPTASPVYRQLPNLRGRHGQRVLHRQIVRPAELALVRPVGGVWDLVRRMNCDLSAEASFCYTHTGS
jgi:hypothetical protein